MARAGLDWTQHDLAEAAGVSWRTVARFEGGESVMPAQIQKMRHALESVGILFIDNGRLVGGVIPPRLMSS
jgi:predicted transcriptional regulator